MKRLIPLVTLLTCSIALADEQVKADVPIKPASIQAVMYEFTYNTQTQAITHAQVIGGYATVDDCREAMPKVVAMGSPQLDSGEQMQLQCSGIKSSNGSELPAEEGPAVTTTNL
jgi:hypothetical protein